MTMSLNFRVFELGHVVNAAAVEALRVHIRGITIAPRRLDLDCATVHTIDPVGAALLWLLCTELQCNVNTHVRLVRLPVPVAQKLRSHPLSNYLAYGEDLFEDPFQSALPSNR